MLERRNFAIEALKEGVVGALHATARRRNRHRFDRDSRLLIGLRTNWPRCARGGANRVSGIYTPAFEPAILWVRALASRTDIFGCRFSIQAATALPFS
jgi:hypothetical protein